jgi:hypothetical protein
LRRQANAQETSAAALAQKVGPEKTMAAAESTIAAIESTRIVLEETHQAEETPTPKGASFNQSENNLELLKKTNSPVMGNSLAGLGGVGVGLGLGIGYGIYETIRQKNRKNEKKVFFTPEPSIQDPKPNEIEFLGKKLVPNLPDKATFDRNIYFIPETNKTSKTSKKLFKENWEIFENSLSDSNLGFDTKLELARDYINEINDRDFTDKDLLKSMKRSFASRIGRQKRLSRLEGNLPKWEDIGYTI